MIIGNLKYRKFTLSEFLKTNNLSSKNTFVLLDYILILVVKYIIKHVKMFKSIKIVKSHEMIVTFLYLI